MATVRVSGNDNLSFAVRSAVAEALVLCLRLADESAERVNVLPGEVTEGVLRDLSLAAMIAADGLLDENDDETVALQALMLLEATFETRLDVAFRENPHLSNDGRYKLRQDLNARANSVRESLTSLLELLQNARTADESARRALSEAQASDEARRKAMTVAATSGDEKLSGGFGTLARKEAIAAGLWTTAAIITTVAGVAAGWGTHVALDSQGDLARVLYPAVLALAFGGLAAYFARLGGHRRHTAQWAKSVAVQLDSYEKFIHHADEGARGPIFDRFAARVLGDPPVRNAKGDQTGFSLAEVLALLTKTDAR